MHWDLVVRLNQVNLGEDSFACQIGSKVLGMWDGISVRSCLVVELSIITTRSPISVLLNHAQRGCPHTRRRSDDAHVDELGKFSFRACKLFWRKTACSSRRWTPGCNDAVCYTVALWPVACTWCRQRRELAQGLGVWVTSCERSRDTAQKLGDDVECSVLIRVPFLVSMRRLWSRSTSSLCCNRKSAPIMAWVTSASTNRQVRERGSPKSRVHCW